MSAATNEADPTLGRLREELARCLRAELLEARSPVALLDFPNHGNVGDSAIWLGQRRLLRELDLPVAYASSAAAFDTTALERRVGTSGTILLLGGGNFGDLWPRHQRFREMITDRYPAARIVQLPQSLFFADQGAIDQARATFAEHVDFHLFYRDDSTDDLADAISGGRATRCPDTALALELERTREPDLDVLFLLREDHERLDGSPLPEAELSELKWRVADWPHDPFSAPREATRVIVSFTARRERLRRELLTVAGGRKLTGDLASRHWDALAHRRLDGGLDLLSSARVVVTDRLHGHILCLVAGIPHVFLDNSYGKVSAFSRTWGTAGPLARPADDLTRAVAEAKMLLDLREDTSPSIEA